MLWPVLIAISFLSGSVPFGLFITRARGVDIRKHGSGNIGATNVLRVLGPRAGFTCLALDIAKGFVPTFAAGLITGTAHEFPIDPERMTLWLTVMVAAIFGHMFSPWIGFKGGKGVATGLGAMLGIYPYLTFPALAALVVFITIAAIWRYVGFASCFAAVSLPLWIWLAARIARAGHTPEQLQAHARGLVPAYIVSAILAALVIYRHRGNLRRMLEGRENRLSFRPGSPPPGTSG